jgi:hypothetical protein
LVNDFSTTLIGWFLCPRSLKRAPPGATPADPEGRLVGNAAEPSTQRLGPINRPALLNQHHECQLKRILGVMRIAQYRTTNAHDHRTMAGHQRTESNRIVLVHDRQ